MIRSLLAVAILFTCVLGWAQDEVYFSEGERASMALLLRAAVLLKSDEQVSPESMQRLVMAIEKIKLTSREEPETIIVKSFSEFLQTQKKSNLFSYYKLDELSDEKLLEKIRARRYTSESSSVVKKIEFYEKQRLQKYRNFLYFVGYRGLSIALSEKASLKDIKEEFRKQFELNVQQMIASLNQSATSDVIVLSRLLKYYFNALPFSQKAEILYHMSQMSLDSKPTDVFLVMIQNAGPQLQKLVQIMGRSNEIPYEFKAIFQRLESEVSAVPWWKVHKALEQEGVDISVFNYFERKPLGVGTMAQTHRAQWRNSNGQRASIVLRFLKPGMSELLEMDHQILLKIAVDIDDDPELKHLNLPALADLVEDIHSSVVEELYVAATIENQNEAAEVYAHSEVIEFHGQKNILKVLVPRANLIGSRQNVMLQELVFGQKPAKEFAQYKDLYPDLYKKVSERLSEMWVNEAFFQSGFFHADLHQGNILASVSDEDIRVGILDYGMVGRLNKELRDSALMLAIGIKLERADIVAKYFLKLRKQNDEHVKVGESLNEEQLTLIIQDRFYKIKKSEVTFESWMTWAMDLGLDFDYEFLKLNRGLKAIQGMLTDSGSQETIYSIAIKMAIKNKTDVLLLLLREPDLKFKDLFVAAFDFISEKPEIKAKAFTKVSNKCQHVFQN